MIKARSSVGERYPDTVEVGSSILPVPTIVIKNNNSHNLKYVDSTGSNSWLALPTKTRHTNNIILNFFGACHNLFFNSNYYLER